jgi:hypothetical protein
MRYALLAALALFAATPLAAQSASDAERNATREQLRAALATGGARSDVGLSFQQSDKNPYNFVALMKTGLANAEAMEIVVGVSKSRTVSFRVYPHYHGGYVNLDRVKDPAAFRNRLLKYNDDNFLYWGADSTGDVFAGFTITLESGFPSEAVIVVLRSLRGQDKFVGELRPLIDGSAAAP